MPDQPIPWQQIAVPALDAGDWVAARRWAEAAVHDELQCGRLRALMHELAPGVELLRASDHQLADLLASALVSGRIRWDTRGARRPLLALAPPPGAPAAAPPPPASASRSAPAAAPPPAPDSTFDDELDAAAMAAVLQQAAQDGVPFCEECAKAAAAEAAA